MNTDSRKIISNLLSKYNEKFKTDKSMMGNEKQACQSLIVPLIRDFLCWDADDPSELGTEEFKEKDKGNLILYYRKEIMTWNKVKEEFPEYSEIINDDFICNIYGFTKETKK